MPPDSECTIRATIKYQYEALSLHALRIIMEVCCLKYFFKKILLKLKG